jgi:hypothetical protein
MSPNEVEITLVEHEVGVLAAVVAIALFREQTLAEPGALDRLQKLLGDDHVGVDIDHLQRRGDAFEHGELFHVLSCEEPMRASVIAKWRVGCRGSTLCRGRG